MAPEYLDDEGFFARLRAFHQHRGTNLDTNARVNGKHIDLRRLFDVVSQRGGYDAVSSEKLAWRKVGQEFNLGQTNTAAYAFALKTVYYKNLAAFEIKIVHNREPPPREILENISAKGGDLLTRTLENFRPPQAREHLVNGHDSDGSDEEGRTPKEEKMDIDDPSNTGGRSTRGLRQAPPQRVLFQPDVSSTRQRNTSSHMHSPQPTSHSGGYAYNNPSSNPNSTNFSISNYEPRMQMPLTLRPVVTPSNNLPVFQEKIKQLQDARATQLGLKTAPPLGMMLPGTGFDGPNIYVRTLLALRSGLPAEQDYALHHLVKISHERGDKYKFEAFPGLAEGLIEKVLEISPMFYNVKWEISYEEAQGPRGIHVLDGLDGTSDILERLKTLELISRDDDVEPQAFAHKLLKINEAGLVIRNMVLLEDNARYLSDMAPLRDFLTIALNLPNFTMLTELRHYALDISEQLTRFWILARTDPLYISLLKQLETSTDRGAIITILRAICRISMNLDESNRLEAVPLKIIERLIQWTLLEDEELVHACLDFLYQYTAVPDNVTFLLQGHLQNSLSLHPLFSQLTNLLLYGAKETSTARISKPTVPGVPAKDIPAVPIDLLQQIVKCDEPERSSHWLRACFEEDAESEITQIQLWQAYQARFSEHSTPQNPLLPAAEFIKNVSTTFPTANAQVIQTPQQKFIIKGIRFRHAPMNTKGRVYSRCLWKASSSLHICGEFFLEPQEMWDHIIFNHARVPKDDDGKYDLKAAEEISKSSALETNVNVAIDCHWADCRHFTRTRVTHSLYALGMHVKTHLPDSSTKNELRAKYNRTVPEASASENGTTSHENRGFVDDIDINGREAEYEYQTWFNTIVDDRGDAAGLPLTAVLILRNLARNIPKAVGAVDYNVGGKGGVEISAEGKEGWLDQFFSPGRAKLWYVMAHNRSLTGYVEGLINVVESGVNG
ncbi:MAG: Chromatin structure-remodeling complex protein rsc9 [Icmadophila ericetorum]|nr:Chromatin structure-remodeling complex protein rsc9 [Icmadophila ericetorum]